jgi:hypothetical protein
MFHIKSQTQSFLKTRSVGMACMQKDRGSDESNNKILFRQNTTLLLKVKTAACFGCLK